ncbi:hypothetical protein MKW94_019574 [Papaver nudicaule]|uniref:procollagen-proline 4-dioxygenase n=1 Tax=Papaver nudicaule TaxID=74823 RepID=A0AA41UYE2_PAPNU|nr:hypothetical protein [Papaver nudicaule]MCL7034809.1 hypothetical protein [Papaver nudicaule]
MLDKEIYSRSFPYFLFPSSQSQMCYMAIMVLWKGIATYEQIYELPLKGKCLDFSTLVAYPWISEEFNDDFFSLMFDMQIYLSSMKLSRKLLYGTAILFTTIDIFGSRLATCYILQSICDEVIKNIETRIAAWTFLPEENGEAMQILHYENGQKYEPHYDYFHDKVNQEYGGQRIATVLMYLSNVEKGGETVFPDSEGKASQVKDESWSDCAKKGYAVKTRKGDALLFFGLNLDTSADPTSLHGSCPVIEGEKWSATKWIHVRDFDKRTTRNTDAGCTDEDQHCEQWAAVGECEKNPVYMVGTKDAAGYCRKSCNVC